MYILQFFEWMTIRKLFYISLLFMISLPSLGQDLQVGFGWGLINFKNNVIERKGFSLLSYKVNSDYKYSFILKYLVPGDLFRFKGGYYFAEINGLGKISEIEPEENSRTTPASTETSLITVALGLEYFYKEYTFKPYLGLDLLIGIFEDVDVRYRNQSDELVREIYSAKSRIGLGLNAGLSYEFFPGMSLEFNMVYSSLNFLGKEDFEENIITSEINVSLLFVL